MNDLTLLFAAALTAETATRLWLSTRQLAAVALHRDRVPAAFEGLIALVDQQKAADYTASRVRLGRWATLLEALVKLALTVGGGLAWVDAAVPAAPLHGAWVLLSVFVLVQLVGLPFAVWRTFRIEARFGFNRITPRLFAVDWLKRIALALALGGPLAAVTLLLMERTGPRWWVWAWVVYVSATLILTWAAPRFIAPLFNRFTAITDAVLRQRIEALLGRCGFSAAGGVFVMDGSTRSAHGNAYFTGIGRNKRIVFFDTLLARIDLPEIEAVLAHELGHFRLHHVRQRLVTSLLVSLAGFALLGWLTHDPHFYSAFGARPSSAMALLLFALTLPPFLYFTTPFSAWWSRRQEAAADEFAVSHADPAHLMSALVKLYRDNASTLTPDPVHSAFYDSHPSAVERIARLKRLAARAPSAA